jgi:multidrug efflux pump subunit AcrB
MKAPRRSASRFPEAFSDALRKGFENVRERYHALLETALKHDKRFAAIFLGAMVASAILAFPFGTYLPGLGQDFFPTVDSGQIKLHLRARTGTAHRGDGCAVRRGRGAHPPDHPGGELSSIVDNIGLPYSGINTAYSTSAPIGPSDADIFIALKEKHHPSADYQRRLRRSLGQNFPSTTFAFLPADIVSQTLNFGLPSPIDVQIVGMNVAANHLYADDLLQRCERSRAPWICASSRPPTIRGSMSTSIGPRHSSLGSRS